MFGLLLFFLDRKHGGPPLGPTESVLYVYCDLLVTFW